MSNREEKLRRFGSILLSLGLVIAVSCPAFALDVKFSGSFYAVGVYLDKTSLTKTAASDNVSTAFHYQRLRLQTDFTVSPGLSIVARFDVLERIWGDLRSAPLTIPDSVSPSAGSRAENENIACDWAYLSYTSPPRPF